MRLALTALLLAAFASTASAEIIITTDGRKIELNLDGTYKLIESSPTASIKLVQQEPFFEFSAGEYGQKSMRFMPVLTNESGKTVTGFRFRSVFRSAFGDEVFAFNGESSERVRENGKSTAEIFYFFEDNQFISDEPFDKLSIFKDTATGTITTTVTAVVFEGGEVVKISEP